MWRSGVVLVLKRLGDSGRWVVGLPTPQLVLAALVLGWVVGMGAGAVALSRGRIIEVPPPLLVATALPTPTPTLVPTPTAVPTPRPEDPAVLEAIARSAFPPPPAPRGVSAYAGGPVARISAPRVHLDHQIERVEVVGGEMQAPIDGNYTVGWYPQFDRPGSGQNVVFSAHETWGHMQGPFFFLSSTRPGDDMFIDMADGRRFRYEVISNIRYQVDIMPMQHILWPPDRGPSEERITLITCGGRIVYGADGFGEYLDRDVVVARRVA